MYSISIFYFIFYLLVVRMHPTHGPELAQSLTIVRYTDPRTHSLTHSLPGLAISNAKI